MPTADERLEPADRAPPLTWWGQTWRYLLVIGLSLLGWWNLASWQLRNEPWWFALDLVIGLGCLVLVWFRRRWPLAVALSTAVLGGVSLTAGGPATLALVSLATRRRWREIVPVTALSLLGVGTVLLLDPTSPNTRSEFALQLGVVVPLVLATVGWGMYIGSRRELLASLRERARRAEDEQEARVAQARTAERTRIAREMHDVLAHRISLVSMHADAMVFREDLDADGLRRAATVIQESSHRALRELREVLGVLRDDPGDATPERPQPAAGDVEALVAEAVSGGMRVELDSSVDLAEVPESVGRALYRIVQESLTNARKHAPGARVSLSLRGSPTEGLAFEARNPRGFETPRTTGRDAPSSGLGLVGLAERASLSGGRMRHHRTAEDDFVLEVWLPWPP